MLNCRSSLAVAHMLAGRLQKSQFSPCLVGNCGIFCKISLHEQVNSREMQSIMASSDPRRLKLAFLYVFVFTVFIWWLKLAEMMFGWNFLSLGVYPLELRGLPGIITAPLVHGSWEHVLANSLPLLLLGTALLYGYPRSRWWTILIVWIGSGIGVGRRDVTE